MIDFFLFSIPSSLNKTIPIIFFLFSSYGCCSSTILLLFSPSFSHSSKKCSKFSILAPHSLHPTSPPWCLFLSFNLRQFALALYIITEDVLLPYISSSLISFFSFSYIFKLDFPLYLFLPFFIVHFPSLVFNLVLTHSPEISFTHSYIFLCFFHPSITFIFPYLSQYFLQ